MTPEEIIIFKEKVDKLENFMNAFLYSDRYITKKHFQFQDGKDMSFGGSLGTRIGTNANQKIAFYGGVPVVQAGSIADPTGGLTIDAAARTAIVSILTVLRNITFIST